MAPNQASITPILLATGVASGVALHQVFKRVEIDGHPALVLGIFAGALFCLAIILPNLSVQYESFWSALSVAWLTVSCAVISLLANILIYRAFFHPLNNFPGPFGAKLSKFWALRQVVKSKFRWYQVSQKLHEQYGDYVRIGKELQISALEIFTDCIGPRELTIYNAEAINQVLGFSSKARKGPFYGAVEVSLHATRDPQFHRQRRKIWDIAFKQILFDYGPAIEEFTDSLLARVERNVGRPITINELSIHYSYDVMSLLAFGNPTKFLEGNSTETATKVLNIVSSGIIIVGALVHVPWILTLLKSMSFGGSMTSLGKWSEGEVEKRKNACTSLLS